MRNLLGGKGANLAEMTSLGLPIPQGFIISTEACLKFYDDDRKLSEELKKEVQQNIQNLNQVSGLEFGSTDKILLVSVRSGAKTSMPGMMDTILNLGLNDEITKEMAKTQGNLAYDSYRRLIQMFGDVVKEMPSELFENKLSELLLKHNLESDHDFTTEGYKELTEAYKDVYKDYVKEDFPQDPLEQVYQSIEAVFRSWFNPRARYYRSVNKIPDDWGTAVTIQQMVFGNNGENSSSGVYFSRNPATGENKIYGEYLVDAQGEDVVAGTHTPLPLDHLKENNPQIYQELQNIAQKLEIHYGDMQDMEFTVDDGKLYILQTRSGKRSAKAAMVIANALIDEKITDLKGAIKTIDDGIFNQLLHPSFSKEALKNHEPLGKGLPASPGAASGIIALTSEKVEENHREGIKSILVRRETSPNDIQGMDLSTGILTSRGGLTSHAAVVTRGIGKPCIVGSNDLTFHDDKTLSIGDQDFKEGDLISIDGESGLIYKGLIPIQESEMTRDLESLLVQVDKVAKLTVLANAEKADDIQRALDMGAKGVGLVRTEHMFFESDRLGLFQEMILSDNDTQIEEALKKILPIQTKDFEEIFEVTKELPATIRLLDPPLHEFMPTDNASINKLAKQLYISEQDLKGKISQMAEENPMMGHRGCRLAISHPQIPLMQTEAIIKAALKVNEELKIETNPHIMIPLIGDLKEFMYLKDIIVERIDRIQKEAGKKLKYQLGTMIELPRACIIADQLAPEVDFFSFGTNDLTQMTFGLSRDDAGSFLEDYYEHNIYDNDPFQTLDVEGVGALITMAVKKGKKANPDLKIGVCGEHAGDPQSIEFFKTQDIDTISCSPYRVPLARLKAY